MSKNPKNRSQYVPPVYPPLLANVQLTRLKPFKDAAFARSESERIGNNYSHQAKDLKLVNKRKKSNQLRKSIRLQDIETEEIEKEILSRPVSPISQKQMIINDNIEPSQNDLERFEHFMSTIKGFGFTIAV